VPIIANEGHLPAYDHLISMLSKQLAKSGPSGCGAWGRSDNGGQQFFVAHHVVQIA
jgi:hypothetical protein